MSEFWKAWAVGMLVFLSVYILLARAFPNRDRGVDKALAFFGGILGVLTWFWLLDNPSALAEYSKEIVLGGLGILLAFLAFARGSAK